MTGPGSKSRAGRKPEQDHTHEGETPQRPTRTGRVVRYVERLVWLKQVQADRGLPPSALTVALTIVDHVDGEGEAFPSQETMATVTGLNVRAVRRATDAMATKGHLTIKTVRGRPAKNASIQKYHNRYVPLWKAKEPETDSSTDNGQIKRLKRAGFSGGEGAENRSNGAAFEAGKPDISNTKTGQSEQENRTQRAAYQTFGTRPYTPDARNSAPDVGRGMTDDALRALLVEAAGGNVEPDSVGIRNVQPIRALIAEGLDLEQHILPAIVANIAGYHQPLRTWKAGWIDADIRKRAAGDYGSASTTAKSADQGPTVAIPGHETTRWPADMVTTSAARWWSSRHSDDWIDGLGETPDRPDPRRSPEFQTALDAGRAEIEVAARAWPANRDTWDIKRLGPRPDSRASRLGPDFGVQRVLLRHGAGDVTAFALDAHLRLLASDFDDGEFVRCYRALPTRLGADDCTLPLEWQRKALAYRSASEPGSRGAH